MKKNISEPEPSISDLAAALSVCQMIHFKLMVIMRACESPKRDIRRINKVYKNQRKNFLDKRWIEGLDELKVKSYRRLYRSELKKLVEMPREEFVKACENHGREAVDDVRLGLLGTKKMFEYLTGEDLNGKKIHEGLFDND